ncbi:MFS general substrate transporter [Obba rivulosa]|uniref:MFS general substrate transporter n=1 Tax=Obba rivulosa TaxID=1052685 RepID=A0A8E2ATV3_9APHY|nr:MFS general substrate transporter [Obba rivulosa]
MTVADETAPLLRDEPTGTDYGTRDGPGSRAEVNNDQSEAAEDIKPPASLVTVLGPMILGIFLVAMDYTIVTAIYASIGSQFQSLQNTSWIATGYMLSTTSFQPLYGKLSDIFGRKPCLIFAYTVFALGCLFCGLARNMPELIAARAFAGIGGGGMTTISSIVMSDIVPLRQRGTWQGFGNIAFAAGQATGAPLGGLLADSIGWRWAFLIQVPATLLAILSVSVGLQLPKKESSDFRAKLARVDFGGASTLVVAVFALLLALDHGGNVTWNDRTTIISFVAAGVFFLAFIAIEARIAREPFAPARIVARPALLFSYLCNFFALGAALCYMYHISLYLQAVRGMRAGQAGLSLLPSIFGGVLGSLMSGLIMQATGKYYVLTLGVFGMMLSGTVLSVGVTGALTHSLVGLFIGLALTNFGNGAGITTTLIALIANAGQADQALATAVSYLFRSLGSVVGLSVGTTIAQDTLRRQLRKRLTGADVDEIIMRVRESLEYMDTLAPKERAAVVLSYQDGIQAALWFTVALSVCALVCAIFVKEKPLAR